MAKIRIWQNKAASKNGNELWEAVIILDKKPKDPYWYSGSSVSEYWRDYFELSKEEAEVKWQLRSQTSIVI